MTPSEALGRFVSYDAATQSLFQVGNGIDPIYQQSNKNFQPRVGFAWDVFKNQKSVLRGGYGYQVMEPATNYVSPLGGNPPFVLPVNYVNSNAVPFLPIATVFNSAPQNIAIRSIDPNFHNAYTQSYNLNFQQELTPSLGLMVGYFGSEGIHLEIDRNINQPTLVGTNPVTPVTKLSATSPIAPGLAVGRIREADSSGTSNYNALWVSANKRLAHGIQFNASYTWSHSIDDNSQNSQGIVVQDSNNIRGDRADSDFDARHRFVINAIYDLPWKGNRLVEGFEFSTIVQLQSGNPFTIFATNPAFLNSGGIAGTFGLAGFNGVGNIRPDAGTSSIAIHPGSVQYFTATTCNPIDTRAAAVAICNNSPTFILPASFGAPFTPIAHFGNVHRNAFVGPGFQNIDFSLLKTTKITERVSTQFRFEAFDLFNHPNYGQPGSTAGAAGFGLITSTRFPTGDSGSSRQLQAALKLIF
jgi:hypothetical protein